MPTVAEILAGIDSFVTPAKRRVVDMLMNPRAAMAQTAGRLSDDSNAALRDLNTQADANMLRAQGSVMADLPQYRQAEDASRQRIVNMLMNFAPVGATVWHGSPHKFDKFDSSKIGTGEGAQAYGHGLYFGGNKQTGEWYKKSLGEPFGAMNAPASSALQKAVQEHLKKGSAEIGGVPDAATARDWISQIDAREIIPMADEYAAHTAYERLVRKGDGGNLYKVDLPDEAIAKMLDWDKPLSQQSREVQKAVEKYTTARIPAEGLDMGGGGRILANHNGQVKPNSSSPYVLKSGDSLFDISEKDVQRMLSADKGEAAYTRLTAILGGQPQATDYLRQAGIPGIRYLDGGSRGAGQGTSNYVVFPGNEGLLNILERNGKPIK